MFGNKLYMPSSIYQGGLHITWKFVALSCREGHLSSKKRRQTDKLNRNGKQLQSFIIFLQIIDYCYFSSP